MKALISNQHLIIREGGSVVARRPCASPKPRDVVDRANSMLARVGVTGDNAEAWVLRKKLAEQVIREVLA